MFRFQQNELSLFFGSTTTINNNQPSTAVAHREFSHQTPQNPQKTETKIQPPKALNSINLVVVRWI